MQTKDFEPIGRQVVALPHLTRRQFLGGLILSPPAMAGKLFAADTFLLRHELAFELSEDGSSLTVSEVAVTTRDAEKMPMRQEERVALGCWMVPAAAFGPRASFDLQLPGPVAADDTAVTVIVRTANFGGRDDVTVELLFTRVDTKADSRWFVDWRSNLWPGSAARAPTAFSHFLQGAAPTKRLPATTVGSVVSRVFDARIGSAPRAARTCSVSLDCHLVWHLVADEPGKPLLSAIGGRADVASFQIAWHVGDADEASFLGGRAPAAVNAFSIGDAGGPRLGVKPATDGTPQLELRQHRQPLRSDETFVVAALRIPRGSVVIDGDTSRRVGPLDAFDLVVTQAGWLQNPPKRRDVPLRAPYALVRTVVSGSALESKAAGKDDKNGKAAPRVAVLRSPLGPMRVTTADLDSAAPAADSAAPSSAADPVPPVAAPSDNPAAASRCVDGHGDRETDAERSAASLLVQTAIGDRAGAPTSTIFAVYDEPADTGAPRGMRRIGIDLALVEAPTALPDASYSRLDFSRGELRLVFEDGRPFDEFPAGEYPRPPSASFIWLGAAPAAPTPHAVLDLSRAELTCARDYDLMKLRMRFNDLALEFVGDCAPTLKALHPSCRVLVRDGVVDDSRPTLLVEFDPQHVLEEAILAPEPLPLPDIDDAPWTRQDVVDALAGKPQKQRAALREAVQQWKTRTTEDRTPINAASDYGLQQRDSGLPDTETASEARTGFRHFCDAYRAAAETAGLPADQRIYIGPFALDADAMAVARRVQRTIGEVSVRKAVTQALTEADDLAGGEQWHRLFRAIGTAEKDITFADALRREAMLEQALPMYGAFREFWRDVVVRLRSPNRDPCTLDMTAEDAGKLAALLEGADSLLDEYLSKPNADALNDQQRTARQSGATPLLDAVVDAFVRVARGIDPVCGLQGARLSGRTRLAFRINCEALAGIGAEEAGLASANVDSRDRPGSGGDTYGAIPFTFEALSDWSHHELAVTRRVQKLYEPLASGRMPPLGNRAANVSDVDTLRFQGMSEGDVTARQRMTEIQASLRQMPTAWEMCIEIPSRIFLSTAQDALWRSPRRLPAGIATSGDDARPRQGTARGTSLEEGTAIAPGFKFVSPAPHGLWSARLLTDDMAPGLRVIGSPDLRLTALTPAPLDPGPDASPVQLPGQSAPPRGPWAPWFIGPEQSESGTMKCETVAAKVKSENGSYTSDELKAFCTEPQPKRKRPGLLDWLFWRSKSQEQVVRTDYRLFRTALDANDRHQLVLLSSAYGLPVIGRREAPAETPDKDEASKGTPKDIIAGALIKDSGQIEPGDRFRLVDGADGQAIYRPTPLDVQELTLSALGGSFLHDTAFKPPAGGFDAFGHKIFDGMSIERWQHDIVLGRDMRAEVVYKGYLLPLGHRASLVKLTERVFMRLQGDGGIKAMLRQRFFIRVATPRKSYPAVGQAHAGRLWCGKLVTLLTTRTPDLLDPAFSIDGDPSDGTPEALNGRIHLRGGPGLAFWPRTDITAQGLVRFDIDIDGAVSRMPLLFLDNIAATSPASLRAAVSRYNDAADELVRRRELAFGGQKLMYAEEKSPGDTRYVTESLRVRVHGRQGRSDGSWTGALDEFDTTSILEGAGQPPFYPALELGTIRLAQAERFSGGEPMRAQVQYDGEYVRQGFPKEAKAPDGESGESAAKRNQEPDRLYELDGDVYLNLREPIKLDMGSNGERSAAIARPHSYVIALSRTQGLLGNDGDSGKPVVWHRNESEKLAFRILDDCGNPQEIAPVAFHATRGLVSLVRHFSTRGKEETRSPPEDDVAPAVARQEAPGDDPDDFKRASRKLAVLQSYFSGDAKVLGTIRLKDLLLLLQLTGADSTFPQLREVVDYGASVNDRLNGVADDVRTDVLVPLREAIGRLHKAWKDLDVELAARQKRYADRLRERAAERSPSDEATRATEQADAVQVQVLSIDKIYGEVAQALDRLDTQLAQALTDGGLSAQIERTAEIYQSARTLLRALGTLTSNPTERLEEAIGANLQTQLAQFDAVFEAIRYPGKILERLFDTATEFGGETVWRWLNSAFEQRGQDAQQEIGAFAEFLCIVPPDLNALCTMFDFAVGAEAAAMLAEARGAIVDAAMKSVPNLVRKILVKAASSLLDPTQNALERNRWPALVSEALLQQSSKVTRAVDDARQAIEESAALDAPAKQLLDAVLAGYRGTFEGGATVPPSLDRAIHIARQGGEMLKRVRNMVAVGRWKDGSSVRYAGELLAFVFGSRFENSPASLQARLDNVRVYLLERVRILKDVIDPSFDATLFAAEFAWAMNAPDPALRVPGQGGTALTELLRKLCQATTANSTAAADAIQLYRQTVLMIYHVRVIERMLKRPLTTPGDIEKALRQGLVDAVWANLGALRAAAKSGFEALGRLITPASDIGAALPASTLRAVLNSLLPLTCLPEAAGAARDKLRTELDDLIKTAGSVGIEPIGSESRKELADAVQWGRAPFEPIVDQAGESVQQLLARELYPGTSIGNYVSASAQRIHDIANAEKALYLAGCELLQHLRGLPDALADSIHAWIGQSKPLDVFGGAYRQLLDVRNALYDKIAAMPSFLEFSKQALLAPTDDRFEETACASKVPVAVVADGLAQEVQAVACIKEAPGTADGERNNVKKRRANFIRVLGAWANPQTHRPAALVIGDQIAQLVEKVISGDILAVIDLSAFREQIEDAIANLIPTRARLSYDFASTVKTPSKEKAIFQPQVGATFGIHVRADVDLLHPDKSTYRAYGEMGPFDIMLIGGLVDALRLKFRGAAFEIKSGEKARFDVLYDDFEIGKDLDFTKPLQAWLSPKNGGVFIQPMTRGAGIEAGYGIDLGTIGVGAMSFFNVVLNVSAELPFDDSESLFKVALGRRLAPFTMSAFPFAGSGFFAIYCAADGVRGFEASFEFGGGAAIGFGPLRAQCRVQVGVYVRVLRVNGRNSTTIYGTFFAGGSANIWIFNFSTSLSVRLGKEDGGAMYGEATYSFSFSLGLADYNYSITAQHKENAIGSGGANRGNGGGSSGSQGGGGGGGNHHDIGAVHGGDVPPMLLADTVDAAHYGRHFDIGLIAGFDDPYGAFA